MISTTQLLAILGGFAAAVGALQVIIIRIMNRQSVKIADGKVKAETDSVAVDSLKDVLEEVKKGSAEKDTKIESLSQRVSRLEDRDRLNLVGMALMEAWIHPAYSKLLQHYPEYPPPPVSIVSPIIQPTKVDIEKVEINVGDESQPALWEDEAKL